MFKMSPTMNVRKRTYLKYVANHNEILIYLRFSQVMHGRKRHAFSIQLKKLRLGLTLPSKGTQEGENFPNIVRRIYAY